MFRLTVTFMGRDKRTHYQQHFNFDNLRAAYDRANSLIGKPDVHRMELYVCVETWSKFGERDHER